MITEYALGIDLGATKIAAGLVSRRGDVLCGATKPTPPGQGADAILAAVRALGNEVNARGRAEGLSIVATGMGAAGQIDYPSGRVRYAGATIPNWAGTELVQALQDMFGLPAAADNDVNVLALAEHRFGAALGSTTSCSWRSAPGSAGR